MKVYILFYKVWQLAFWGLVLPFTILILTLPVVLNVIYQLETGIRVSAEAGNDNVELAKVYDPVFNASVYSTGKSAVLGVNYSTTDYRSLVLDEFFKRNNSPLQGFGKDFVVSCNKYDAPYDCTTLSAIAYVETRLCTSPTSHEQRNCWGFGGSGKNRITFSSYPEAIDLITNRLVNAYGSKYMTNPKLMQHTYCGPNCNAWGGAVQSMRYQINSLALEMGYPALIR